MLLLKLSLKSDDFIVFIFYLKNSFTTYLLSDIQLFNVLHKNIYLTSLLILVTLCCHCQKVSTSANTVTCQSQSVLRQC